MLDRSHDFVLSCPKKLAYVMLTEHALVDPRKENFKKNVHLLPAAFYAELLPTGHHQCHVEMIFYVFNGKEKIAQALV